MRIAVIYQYYQDSCEPGHSVVFELTQYLAGRGHEVTVVAGEIGYMKRGDSPHLPWFRRLIRKERVKQVSVLRTYTYSELHRSYLGRLLSFFSFLLSCPIGMMFLKKTDVVLASSPPIFPMLSALLMCKIRRIPFVFEVRDLWPASAVQMGIISNRWQIAAMSWMEKCLYDHAHGIIALTEGIRDAICRRGWPREKVSVVPCSVDSSILFPDANGGARTRNQHGWAGKKIILYFGALGEANNLPVILRTAEHLREDKGILFVLIGDGMLCQATEHKRKRLGLNNMVIMPPVPKKEARLYINAADICLVTLKDIALFEGAIPTKLIEYMACGKPVLCGVRGEAAEIVRSSGAGVVFGPNDDCGLARLIRDLVAGEAQTSKMADAGPKYVSKHFSAPVVQKRMEMILQSAAESRRKIL